MGQLMRSDSAVMLMSMALHVYADGIVMSCLFVPVIMGMMLESV